MINNPQKLFIILFQFGLSNIVTLKIIFYKKNWFFIINILLMMNMKKKMIMMIKILLLLSRKSNDILIKLNFKNTDFTNCLCKI